MVVVIGLVVVGVWYFYWLSWWSCGGMFDMVRDGVWRCKG